MDHGGVGRKTEPPEGRRAAFSKEPSEGALACANSGLRFSVRLPPHIPREGPASCPRLEHLGPDLAQLPRSRSHPIPKTTDLLPGKIFLMSFSLFQDRLLSTRPRSLNPSALGQGIRGEAVRDGVQCPWDGGRAAPPPPPGSLESLSLARGWVSGSPRGTAQGLPMSRSWSVTSKVP